MADQPHVLVDVPVSLDAFNALTADFMTRLEPDHALVTHTLTIGSYQANGRWVAVAARQVYDRQNRRVYLVDLQRMDD
jgi:hypothetical protein